MESGLGYAPLTPTVVPRIYTVSTFHFWPIGKSTRRNPIARRYHSKEPRQVELLSPRGQQMI